MYCILDISRFHDALERESGNVRAAAMRYYSIDNPMFALRCLGADLAGNGHEALALAGYVQSMANRGCSPERIARFMRRFAARVSNDARNDTGWRAYSYLRYDTRIRWEPAGTAHLRAV